MLDIIVNPFTTLLLVLYHLLGENVVLAIVGFTVIIRMAILPLTIKQQRSMKRMQEFQPQLRALQVQYKDDREKLVQEQMRLYKEQGINPMSGCLPLLIQLPIFIGLWQAINAALASTPSNLVGLEHRIIFNDFFSDLLGTPLDALVPLQNHWLWMNLALPDPYYILPVLVVITSWIQQKLLTPAAPASSGNSNDPADQAAQMTRQMTTFMPLFFGFLALTYSSGLSIYFITANIIGIIQYAALGKANFGALIGRPPQTEAQLGVIDGVATSGGRRLKDGIVETRLSSKAPAPATSSASSKSSSAKSTSTASNKGSGGSSSKANRRANSNARSATSNRRKN